MAKNVIGIAHIVHSVIVADLYSDIATVLLYLLYQ